MGGTSRPLAAMVYPRRVRRRLLLPPGWVALGFLLLLGYLTLVPRWRELRLNTVLHISMPSLHADRQKLWHELFYQSPKQLEKYRPWHTVNFNGNVATDFFSAAATEAAIRQIIADTSHAGGVRVRFLPGSTYTDLVRVLDVMNRVEQKKYWLNIQQFPITLYAITSQPPHAKPILPFECGTSYFEAHIPPIKISSQDAIEYFWQELLTLENQPWQTSILLLVVIGSLNLRQLFQPKFGRRYS